MQRMLKMVATGEGVSRTSSSSDHRHTFKIFDFLRANYEAEYARGLGHISEIFSLSLSLSSKLGCKANKNALENSGGANWTFVP